LLKADSVSFHPKELV